MSINQVNMNLAVGSTETERLTVRNSEKQPFMLTGYDYSMVAVKGETSETIALEIRLGDSALWVDPAVLTVDAGVWEYEIKRIKDSKEKTIFNGRVTVA